MSSQVVEDVESDGTICEWCGGEIASDPQECPALDNGRCQP